MRSSILLALLCACAPAVTTTSSGSTSSGSSSSGGTVISATVTTITPDQAVAPVAFTHLPNGHFVLVEGSALRLVELDETGHVVHVNAADFTGTAWPVEVISDDNGAVYVLADHAVYRYGSGISGARGDWLPRNGNDVMSALAWGGTPRRAWGIQADNGTAPRRRLVRFDAATDSAAGEPTVIAEFDRAGYFLAISSDNQVFMADANACRIVKVETDASLSVVVGTELGETGSCYNGGDVSRSMGRVGQGHGLAFTPDGSRLLYSDGSTRALVDVTPGTDGKSVANVALVTFEMGVNNEQLLSSGGAMYVLDAGNRTIRKVVF